MKYSEMNKRVSFDKNYSIGCLEFKNWIGSMKAKNDVFGKYYINIKSKDELINKFSYNYDPYSNNYHIHIEYSEYIGGLNKSGRHCEHFEYYDDV
jgi:hypothetical protein